MTFCSRCRCGFQFCYVCRARWRSCDCDAFNETLLNNNAGDLINPAWPGIPMAPPLLPVDRNNANRLHDLPRVNLLDIHPALRAHSMAENQIRMIPIQEMDEEMAQIEEEIRQIRQRRAAIIHRTHEAINRQRQEQAQEIRQPESNVPANHDCRVHEWRFVPGPHRCQVCTRSVRLWIFRCQRCQMRACRQCRDRHP